MFKYKSIIAGEKLKNHSICYFDPESNKIFNIKSKNDINDYQLVLVDNCYTGATEGERTTNALNGGCGISKDEMCRCLLVNITPKYTF